MCRAELRRMRDRKFVPFTWERHWKRVYAVVRATGNLWDLFPPVKGYRPYSSGRRTYYVSHQKQHRDWSQLVKERDNKQCQRCGVTERLEAHHLWPQGAFPQLRYLLTNGITLCRGCHEKAYTKPEITPNQLRSLTKDSSHVNAIIEANDFWEYYTAGLEKGRLVALGITVNEPGFRNPDFQEQLEWFKSWAKFNYFYAFIEEAASTNPFPDPQLSINKAFQREVKIHDS